MDLTIETDELKTDPSLESNPLSLESNPLLHYLQFAQSFKNEPEYFGNNQSISLAIIKYSSSLLRGKISSKSVKGISLTQPLQIVL